MYSQWYHRVVAFQKSDSNSEAFEFDSSESKRRAQIKIEEAFQSDSSESERRAQIEIKIKKKLWIQIRKNRNTLLRCTLKIR